MEWLASNGALVSFRSGTARTSTRRAGRRRFSGSRSRPQHRRRDADGHGRIPVSLATSGGNQSWTGLVKYFDPQSIAISLFVTLVTDDAGSSRRRRSRASRGFVLGGPKYSRVRDRGQADALGERASTDRRPRITAPPGEYPSGQTGRRCKRRGSVLRRFESSLPHLASSRPVKPTNYERKPGQRGEAVINQKRRLTIPQRPFFEAGFANSGRVRVRADGPACLEQIDADWAEGPGRQRSADADASPGPGLAPPRQEPRS